jgi:hypothetical protein
MRQELTGLGLSARQGRQGPPSLAYSGCHLYDSVLTQLTVYELYILRIAVIVRARGLTGFDSRGQHERNSPRPAPHLSQCPPIGRFSESGTASIQALRAFQLAVFITLKIHHCFGSINIVRDHEVKYGSSQPALKLRAFRGWDELIGNR